MNTFAAWLAVVAVACLAGCTPNTVFFSEETTLGFHAEFKPDASEPISSSLAYKRRIASVVPPQNPNVASPSDWLAGKQNVHQGEALALVSTFFVDTTATQGLTIETHFLSGTAARIATAQDPVSTVKAVISPGTLVPVPVDIQNRRQALGEQLRTMNDERAKSILASLGQALPPAQSARFLLGKELLKAQDAAAVDRLEKAFGANP